MSLQLGLALLQLCLSQMWLIMPLDKTTAKHVSELELVQNCAITLMSNKFQYIDLP